MGHDFPQDELYVEINMWFLFTRAEHYTTNDEKNKLINGNFENYAKKYGKK